MGMGKLFITPRLFITKTPNFLKNKERINKSSFIPSWYEILNDPLYEIRFIGYRYIPLKYIYKLDPFIT